MSKTPQLENVHVDIHGHDNFAAGFIWNGDRYHVWFDPETFEITHGFVTKKRNPILYKNPIGDRNQPGHYETRRLDATKPANKQLVDEMFRQVHEGNMVAKARQHETEKENLRLAEAAEEARIARIKDYGPELLDMLKKARECIAYCRRAHKDPQSGEGVPIEAFIDDLIKRAEWPAPLPPGDR